MLKIKVQLFLASLVAVLLFTSDNGYCLNSIDALNQPNGFFSLELGMGDPHNQDSNINVNGSAILGIGLNSFLSSYLGVHVKGNRFFSEGVGGFFLGSIATIYSSRFFSFDVALETGLANEYFYVTPSLEVRIDAAPDQQFMGLYINAGEHLTGTDTSLGYDIDSTEIDESKPKYVLTPETELRIGYYISPFEGHQFHIRLDQRIKNRPLFNEKTYNIDAIRFGYNFLISDGLQMTTEINYIKPNTKNKDKIGFKIGFMKW